jgi:hypothetical protein
MIEYEIYVSLFASVRDTGRKGFFYGINGLIQWADFYDLLAAYSGVRFRGKQFAPLFAPTEFKLIPRGRSGGYRKAENATMAGMAVIDADGGLGFDEVVRLLTEYELSAIIYTTASNRHDDRFRVVIPFAEPTDVETQKRGVEAICHFLSPGWRPDTSKNNCYSLFYMPGIYPDANNRFVHLTGSILPVDGWIEAVGQDQESIPDPLVRDRQFVTRDPTKVKWSLLRNCWFVQEDWIHEYLGLSDGSYNGLYRFMVRVAAAAEARRIGLSAVELADLARHLELMSGRQHKSWSLATRNLEEEAEHALLYVSRTSSGRKFQSQEFRYAASSPQPDETSPALEADQTCELDEGWREWVNMRSGINYRNYDSYLPPAVANWIEFVVNSRNFSKIAF